jgi:type I restriction enzyme S subunit
MELNEGYKQTDLGIIPNDWDVCKLDELIDLLTDYESNGSFASLAENVSPVNQVSFAWYVRSTDIENDTQISKLRYVDESSYRFLKKTSLFGGELLFLKKGDVGRVYLFKKKTKYATLADNLYLLNLNKKSNSVFLYNYFKSETGQNQIKSKVAASSIAALYKDEVKAILVPLPTITEQSAIATALSDTDILINSLEKLIAKKRNIKQGAMHKLLKTNDEWEMKKLPELVWFQEGPGVRNSQFTNSGVKLLNGTNIEDGKLLLEKTVRYISEKEANGWYSHFLVNDGDILIACSGVSIDKFDEKVTIANSVHLPLCMNTSTMRFQIISKELSKNFFFHFLKSKSFKSQIGGKATGSAQLNFGPSHVKMIDISFPKIEEQIHIATILSDMDAEIHALESKLVKYRNIKLGMMQNLLTGKIRLV